MDPRSQKLSDLLHGTNLPQPKSVRVLVFASIAAVVAAIAGGLAAYMHDYREGHFTTLIGALVGIAVIRFGGYGWALSLYASLLALLSVAASHFLTFTLVTLMWCTEAMHADMRTSAQVWRKLEDASNDQVFAFAKEQGLGFTTREAFDRYPGEMLHWFAANNPSLSEWRNWELANSSFSDYFACESGQQGILFCLAAMLIAAGIVHRRTTKLRRNATQQAIARRRAAGDVEGKAKESSE